MTNQTINIDPSEKARFDSLASEWWNLNGKFKTLHDINPLRLQYIERRVVLKGKKVLDIGCGGGILAESMAKRNASVTGLDISELPLEEARRHSQFMKLDISYNNTTAEDYATTHEHSFDVITCMELLEHVPDPESIISACSKLINPGGHLFFSTINRTLKAYVFAVLGAEYILGLLPVGIHDYSRFIRPSELANWCNHHGLKVKNIDGIIYLPIINRFLLNEKPDVNYLMHAQCIE